MGRLRPLRRASRSMIWNRALPPHAPSSPTTRSQPPRWLRCLATQAQRGSWSSLSASEQAAWQVLGYNSESWEGKQSPPLWKDWTDLTLEEQAAARYGLNVSTSQQWNQLKPSEIPSLESLLQSSYDSEEDTNCKALVAQETRALRKQQQTTNSSWAQRAMGTALGLAPVVGPLLKSASMYGRGRQGLGLSVVGSLLEELPNIMDASSGLLDVTGIDTVLYLDDSCSMEGTNLYQAKQALESLESRLKTDSEDRFLPTRIVKFGDRSVVLSPSEEDWNRSLVSLAWDGTSGGTYMWKMIQEDIRGKYRPAGGKLRVVVITDGADNLSPAPYNGVRGFDPLMKTLLQDGFDIEWHILVVGNYGLTKEISDSDQRLYQSLCHATGGQFLSLDTHGWDEDDERVVNFLHAVEDSGYDESYEERAERQKQYRIEAQKGRAENFDWLPQLPCNDDDKKK
jgi:hypothetical protein